MEASAIEGKKYEWAKMNLDSGAAVTAFPKSLCPEQNGNGAMYRTATGEYILDTGESDTGEWRFKG